MATVPALNRSSSLVEALTATELTERRLKEEDSHAIDVSEKALCDFSAFTRWVEQTKKYKPFVKDNAFENTIANEIRIPEMQGIADDFFIWTSDHIFNKAAGSGKGRDYYKNVNRA